MVPVTIKFDELVETLKRNDADYLFDVLPVVESIFLFGLGTKFGSSDFWINVWLAGVCLTSFCGGVWRTIKSKGQFPPMAAVVFGLAIGFTAASGPATVYASLSPLAAPPTFHFALAQLSMFAYASGPLAYCSWKLFRTASIASKEVIRKRTEIAMLIFSITVVLLQVFYIF